MFTHCSFDATKTILTVIEVKTVRLCNDLKEDAKKIINYEKKEIMPLTDEENKSYKSKKYVIYAKKDLVLMMIMKSIIKSEITVTAQYRGAANSICNLRYKISKEVLSVFHNGSTYDYQFIIKELAKKFEGQFEC